MTTLLEPGGKLDTAAKLTPVRIAVLTISDTRDAESDTSGQILADRVAGAGGASARPGEASPPRAGGAAETAVATSRPGSVPPTGAARR